MNWTDIEDIAEALARKFPQTDPLQERFTALREKVLALPGFSGAPEHCGEKILEAIQMAWLEEVRGA